MAVRPRQTTLLGTMQLVRCTGRDGPGVVVPYGGSSSSLGSRRGAWGVEDNGNTAVSRTQDTSQSGLPLLRHSGRSAVRSVASAKRGEQSTSPLAARMRMVQLQRRYVKAERVAATTHQGPAIEKPLKHAPTTLFRQTVGKEVPPVRESG
ncbi:hypothetical protein FB45DRAFT_1003514 [Roridomyces roridus]|uniref:Uncharacterized protein n=1 Tax=Roridomyces roridus TaxID=1738132 RepID=A0AAD7BTB1_9AGAR|nr:hypothetical protein FB45DRAFT_1003514 [Roridomyces roridus]